MLEVLPLILGTLLYGWQSIMFYSTSKVGLTIAFVGYMIGNIGLILAAKGY